MHRPDEHHPVVSSVLLTELRPNPPTPSSHSTTHVKCGKLSRRWGCLWASEPGQGEFKKAPRDNCNFITRMLYRDSYRFHNFSLYSHLILYLTHNVLYFSLTYYYNLQSDKFANKERMCVWDLTLSTRRCAPENFSLGVIQLQPIGCHPSRNLIDTDGHFQSSDVTLVWRKRNIEKKTVFVLQYCVLL